MGHQDNHSSGDGSDGGKETTSKRTLDIVDAHATLTRPSTERPSQERINAMIPLIVAQQRQPRTKTPEMTRAPAREVTAAKKQRRSARSRLLMLTSVDRKTKLRVDQRDNPIDRSETKTTKDQDSGMTRAVAMQAAAKEKRRQERTFDSINVQAITTPPTIKRSSQERPRRDNPIDQN